jgi:cell division protein FtsL
MSAVAEAPLPIGDRPAALEGGRRRLRRPLTGGVVWIVAVGCLLAGVVALNVVVLQLNVRYDRLSRQRAELQADVALLRAELSTASAGSRIESLAQEKLGLVPASPDVTEYVRIAGKRT